MTTDDMDVHGSATATRAVPRAARRRRAPDEGAPGWSSSELARAETALRQLGRRDCVGDTDGLDELLAGATQQLLAADDEIRVQRAALRGLASETAATVHRRSRAGASPPVPVHSTHPGQSEPAALDVVVAAERAPDLLTWTVPDAGGAERGDTALARGLAEMCGVASSRGGRHEVLVALARAASVGVHGAGSTALTLGPSEAPAAVGYAGELAARLDANQLRCGEGPALLAEQNDDVVISDDLLADARWPRLARIATGTTVRSVLVAPVRVDGRHAGLLTCCSSGPRAFGPGHRDAATTLATAAGSVLAGMFERDRLSALAVHLDLALVSRQEIDEAKGVVIAQRGCTPDEAFAHLAELSQRENVKLRVIAHRIVAEAALPDDAAPTRWRAHGRRAT